MKKIISRKFPVDVDEFFTTFISNKALFSMEQFCTNHYKAEVACSTWRPLNDEGGTLVRQINMTIEDTGFFFIFILLNLIFVF